jgi:hypothetical protein
MTTKPTLGASNPSVHPNEISYRRASVPLSVYRELVRELQVTRGKVESLNTRNQQLVKRNRQLRSEIEKIIARGKELERFTRAIEDTEARPEPSFVIPVRARIVSPPVPAPRGSIVEPVIPVVTIEPETPSRPRSWTIGIAIALVVLVSGLGAFWLVSKARR